MSTQHGEPPASGSVVEWLEATLREAFAPIHLTIEDQSARHAGHPGAAGGGGHYRAVIVSAAFRGQNHVARQRAVFAALGDAMQTRIHALALRALTPEEWRGRPAHRRSGSDER